MNRDKLTVEYLRYVFAQPSINLSQFCKEVGVSRTQMLAVMEEKYSFTDKMKDKIIPVLEKYRDLFDVGV